MKILLSSVFFLALNLTNGQTISDCYYKKTVGFETLNRSTKIQIAKSRFVDIRQVYDDGIWPSSIKSYNAEYVTLSNYFPTNKVKRITPYFVSESPRLRCYYMRYLTMDSLRIYSFKSKYLDYVELYYCAIIKVDTTFLNGCFMPKILVLDHCSIDSVADSKIHNLYQLKGLTYIRRSVIIQK